jgi:hypothetical protein
MPKIRAFDIEADELLLKATKVWCMVVQDIETKQLWKFGPDQISDGIKLLLDSDMIVAHNGIMYDVPVLERLYGVTLPKCLDTLLVSRLVFPDSFNHPLNGNSLEDWGRFLKRPKKEYTGGWQAFSQEMLDYCVGDVELLTDIYLWQRKHAFKYKTAIRLEHDVAKIICQQIINGFTLDTVKAQALIDQLETAANHLLAEMYKIVPPVSYTETKRTAWAAGSYRLKTIKEAMALGYRRGQITPVFEDITTVEEFNPASTAELAKHMTRLYKWKPKVMTDSGKPQLDEKVLKSINNPLARLVLEYRTINKRKEFVKSWMQELIGDRVHGSVITNGAPTGRMSHSGPNMAQVPKVKKGPDKKILMGLAGGFGYECRDCWKARDGWVLVGADASGLELRMLAHEMHEYDGGAYSKIILEGDVHVENQKSAGLQNREQAKTFIYALIYGGGDAKMGSIVGGSATRGRALRRAFEDKVPAYAKLKQRVLNDHKRNNKILYGMDGRPLPVRSEHAALNTVLQSHGAVVMKQALVLFHESAQALYAGRYAYCANVHDEFQIECEPEIAKDLGVLMVSSIRKAGEVLGIKIRLDGEYKIGNTWAETH